MVNLTLEQVRHTKWDSAEAEIMALDQLLDQGGLDSNQRSWVYRRLKRLRNPTPRDRVVGFNRVGGLTKEQWAEVQLIQQMEKIERELDDGVKDQRG